MSISKEFEQKSLQRAYFFADFCRKKIWVKICSHDLGGLIFFGRKCTYSSVGAISHLEIKESFMRSDVFTVDWSDPWSDVWGEKCEKCGDVNKVY